MGVKALEIYGHSSWGATLVPNAMEANDGKAEKLCQACALHCEHARCHAVLYSPLLALSTCHSLPFPHKFLHSIPMEPSLVCLSVEFYNVNSPSVPSFLPLTMASIAVPTLRVAYESTVSSAGMIFGDRTRPWISTSLMRRTESSSNRVNLAQAPAEFKIETNMTVVFSGPSHPSGE
jgi:hypothetical protein